jgi:RNA polymerase sigma-70 factor (ECF subfamily)
VAHLSSSPLSPGPKALATAGGSALEEPPLDPRGLTGLANDDLALVRRLVTGDGAAWKVLVSGYQRLVLARVIATARELNQALGSSDAEDLCAEVFSQLVRDDYSALKRFEGRSTLATWLCVVTRRIVLRRLVVARREPSLPAAQPPVLEALPGPASEEPLSVIISEEDRELLASEIARLSERHRELARLFYIEGKSYREISEELGISMNSIGPTLGRIHEKLRVAMGGAKEARSTKVEARNKFEAGNSKD